MTTISNLLFGFEVELSGYLNSCKCEELDDPTRQAVVDLLGQVHAARMLAERHAWPDQQSHRASVKPAAQAGHDDVGVGDDWDEQD